jgi:hypothetical protein
VRILRVNSRAYGGESVWKQKAVEKMKYISLAESYVFKRIKPDIIKKRSQYTGIFTVVFQLKIWLIHETQLTL